MASRRSRTSSSRRSTSASSASISCAGAASRRASAAQTPRWRSCPKASRASCGPGVDAVGQVLPIEPDSDSASRRAAGRPAARLRAAFVVVGVARDVAGFRFGDVGLAAQASTCRSAPKPATTSLNDARARRFRARAPCARRSAGGDRSQHGRGLDAADDRRAEVYLLGIPFWLTLVLGSAGASSDVVGTVQRALVSRRATHQGDRRADGARRDQRGSVARARAVTVGSSRRHRAAPRRQPHGRARRRASGDARGSA